MAALFAGTSWIETLTICPLDSMTQNESQIVAPRKRRFRFTIRTLLFLFVVVATAIVWLSYPTRVATHYANALNTKDYATANELCIGKPIFPGKISDEFFEPNATIAPVTFDDIWNRRRRIIISVDYGAGGGIANYGVQCTAVSRGIVVDPVMMP
jgi:hypothetical protein